jgi:hypothetical protein
LIVEIDVCYKPLLKAREFLLLLLLLRLDDEAICGVPRSVWRWSGCTGRSTRWDGRLLRMSLRFGNLMDELLVALMPPRRRVSFLLGSVVSSSMLQGDSETKCLLEDVVEDGLDNDDPFFLVKRLVVHSFL